MNEFVDECRSEWRRLGVPDPVADEMAADLAADLEQAEREGASAEDVLGGAASDPRAFAAAWAAERGLIRRPTQNGDAFRFGSRLAAAIGACALVAVIGAALVIPASPSIPERMATAWRDDAGIVVSPDGRTLKVYHQVATESDRERIEQILKEKYPISGPVQLGEVTRIYFWDKNDSGVDARTVGSILLTAGLAGVMLPTMFWLWLGRGAWSPRRAPAAA